MAKSQETFNKKEKEKKRLKRRQDKDLKREERKNEPEKSTSFEDMLAYVDEFGNITDTPPDPTRKRQVIKAEDIEIGVSKQEAPDPADLIRKGIVTFFNESKGYGFIRDQVTQESIFVHVNGLEDEVGENDKVTFETEKGLKGPNAIRVKLVK